jgi:hypothetical protein
MLFMAKEVKGTGNGWKIAAIILAVVSFLLLVALVVETVVFIALIAVGTGLEEMETECAEEICADEQYSSYYFDDYDETCYCYSGDEIVLEQKVELT